MDNQLTVFDKNVLEELEIKIINKTNELKYNFYELGKLFLEYKNNSDDEMFSNLVERVGYNIRTVQRLVQVVEKFEYKAIQNFSSSKVFELLSLTQNEVEELKEQNPDLENKTKKEIRQAVKNFKSDEKTEENNKRKLDCYVKLVLKEKFQDNGNNIDIFRVIEADKGLEIAYLIDYVLCEKDMYKELLEARADYLSVEEEYTALFKQKEFYLNEAKKLEEENKKLIAGAIELNKNSFSKFDEKLKYISENQKALTKAAIVGIINNLLNSTNDM